MHLVSGAVSSSNHNLAFDFFLFYYGYDFVTYISG